MIKRLKNLFTPTSDVSDTETSRLSIATAALLVEVMIIDGNLANEEQQQIKQLLLHKFDVPSDILDELIKEARSEVSKATSLFQFTRLINDNFSAEQKFELLKGLWMVAYTDQQLDKHEEHIIRRIADLLHLTHSEFIRAKQAVRN